MSPSLIVMAKAPLPGRVKTRLCPTLAPEECAALAGCFLRDTLRWAGETHATVIVAYDPPEALDAIRVHAPHVKHWMPQRGEDLGRRQETAIADAVALGLSPILVIGTDSPTLAADHVTNAIASLEREEADVVVGPAGDGGYYLLAVREPLPELFDDIAWSTSDVCRQLLRNAKALCRSVQLLPTRDDVDTPEDLLRLWDELCHDADARQRARATYQWLQSLPSGHPLFG